MAALVASVLLHSWSALAADRRTDDPRQAAGPATRPPADGALVRRTRAAGWLLSLIGAFLIGDLLWDSAPWLGIALGAAALVVVNAAPAFAVTVLRNSRPARTQP
ncbi:hypothetical protein GCM10022231_04840 [Gordonia caeni]|uniref:Uncharacterized protein n=1 Tax=Gordonia caeni TaxID=1007097 RepID=A0ABP7NMH0_9ACTN